MGRIQISHQKQSSFSLMGNNITDFQPYIPTVMAAPQVETSSFTGILYHIVEDQVGSFVSSNIENDNDNSTETLNVVNNG